MSEHQEAPDRGQTVAESIGRAGLQVKEGIIGSLKGINEIEAEIVGLVRNTVSVALKASGSIAHESIDVTKDVIKGPSARPKRSARG